MRLNRNSIIRIAKNKILEANTKLDSLNYQKWQLFVENYNDYFIWNENTDEGKKTLENINEFSDRIRNKLLTTLNKGICFAEWNPNKKQYNVSVTFYEELNWITIQFIRTPKSGDLKIFIEMANYLDALLLVDGTKVINEETLRDFV